MAWLKLRPIPHLGFTGPLDLPVKSTPILRFFLIGRVITHHFLESTRNQTKTKTKTRSNRVFTESFENHSVMIYWELFFFVNIDLSFSGTEKDRTYKAFAFSHTRLMYNDGTTLQDGTHELYVYKVSPFIFGLLSLLNVQVVPLLNI